MYKWLSLCVLLGIIVPVLCFGTNENVKVRDCEPIRIEQCRDLGYNVTGMPNLAGHDDQKDAELQLTTFRPLVEYGCSSQLRFFLCSVYVPMCTEKVKLPIGPCRPMCQNVKNRCEPVLQMFGFPWPALLNCSKFPARNDDHHMCMDGPKEDAPPPKIRPNKLLPTPSGSNNQDPDSLKTTHSAIKSCIQIKNGPENYFFNNMTDPARCSLKCEKDDLFRKEDKRFAKIWISIWTGLCFAASLFVVLTFLIDPQRFHYPERVVILLALCYIFCSISYIIRLIAGRDAIACEMDKNSNERIIISEGLQNTNCTIVFLLLYYFATASYIWWIILAFTSFLAAGLKWSHEAIQRRSSYFHLAAWGLPAIKTIVILVMRSVDADELTGMCYVGYQNPTNLLAFVIIPLLVYLVLGIAFLGAGFIGFFRIRKHLQNGGSETERMELLMVRLAAFSVVYILTSICVIACYTYEYINYELWHDPTFQYTPNIEIFMLKIFMSLVVGISTSLWMWSQKTVHSWKTFFRRLCRCQKKDQKYCSTPQITNFPQYQYHPPKQGPNNNSVSSSNPPPYNPESLPSGFASPPPSLVRMESSSNKHKSRFPDGGQIL